MRLLHKGRLPLDVLKPTLQLLETGAEEPEQARIVYLQQTVANCKSDEQAYHFLSQMVYPFLFWSPDTQKKILDLVKPLKNKGPKSALIVEG